MYRYRQNYDSHSATSMKRSPASKWNDEVWHVTANQNFDFILHQRAFLLNYTVNREQRVRFARQQRRWTLRHFLRRSSWEVKLFVFVIGALKLTTGKQYKRQTRYRHSIKSKQNTSFLWLPISHLWPIDIQQAAAISPYAFQKEGLRSKVRGTSIICIRRKMQLMASSPKSGYWGRCWLKNWQIIHCV